MRKQTIPLIHILAQTRPDAIAEIGGNSTNPLLQGTALFYRASTGGIFIQVEVFHLPDESLPASSGFFGMHIHEFGDCTLPFDKTGGHYNPTGQQHPNHAGDLPPLLSNSGYAWMTFYDSRLSISNIIGKSLIIHARRDDFTSQPSGDAGEMIGCGVIEYLKIKV